MERGKFLMGLIDEARTKAQIQITDLVRRIVNEELDKRRI